jgi:hypothetical protein
MILYKIYNKKYFVIILVGMALFISNIFRSSNSLPAAFFSGRPSRRPIEAGGRPVQAAQEASGRADEALGASALRAVSRRRRLFAR